MELKTVFRKSLYPRLMKIIDRYIGSNVFLTTFFGIVVLSLVLVLGNIFKELLDLLINHDVPLKTVLAFMAFVLPFSLTFTIPWGFLTALLLVFGRISADNELIALKSNGVSILRICIPVFVLAIVLTAVCFWINIEVAPRAEQKMMEAIVEIATSNPISMFSADSVVDEFPDRRVYVGGKKGDKLKNIIVFEMDDMHMPTKMIFAREGKLQPDPENSRLLLHLYNARFEERDDKEPQDVNKIRQGIVMNEGVFPLSLDKFFKEFRGNKRLSSYTLPELISYIAKGAHGGQLEANVELSRRFSAALACIAFALVAIPLGVTTHRKETSVGFAISLAIAFTYFFFIIMAQTFRSNPLVHPVFLMWLPNIIFISLGISLLRRLTRH